MKIQIKHINGSVIFETEAATIKEAVVLAVKNGANLIRAYLSGANLYGANLIRAYLTDADLQGANLSGANLYGADLSGANLYGANLYGANLIRAYLTDADLQGANLYGANLSGANLSGANLSGADLSGANLYGADLYGADLSGANLSGADLSRANLSRAGLTEANLSEAKNTALSIASTRVAPPTGDFIGWKKCRNNVIVKLLIPSRSKRSNAFGRKCRCSYAKVLQVIGAKTGVSDFNKDVIYKKGKIVRCYKWDEDFKNECAGGIHFFITQEEAENHTF